MSHGNSAQLLDSQLAEPFAYHDPTRWGYVTVSTQTGTLPWKQDAVPLKRLAEFLEQVDLRQNVWVSQSEFNRANRRVVNLERLPLLYLDIDIHHVEGYRDLAPQQQVEVLLMRCDERLLPPPSLVVHSGRGLQAKWLLDKPVPSNALPRWRLMQLELCRRLADIGADKRALDASRILRLVGSVNSRNSAEVHIAHVNSCPTMGAGLRADGLVAYDFELLASELLPVDRQELEHRRRLLEADPVMRDCLRAANEDMWRAAEPSNPKGVRPRAGTHPNLQRLAGAQLGWDRLSDLRRLAELRGMEGGLPAGQRNLMVFLGAAFLAQSSVAYRLWDEVRELAQQFAPTWSEQEVRACVCSVQSRTEAALRGERLPADNGPSDPRYKYKNETLINLLEITGEEERELKTIVSDAERRRRGAGRAAARRRAAGAPSIAEIRTSRDDARAKAMALRALGRSFPEIACELGIAVGTAYNYAGPSK
jgi:hypothetical protein